MRTITEQNYDIVTKALLDGDKKTIEEAIELKIEVKFDSIRHIDNEIDKLAKELDKEIKELEEIEKRDIEVSDEYIVKYMINHTQYTSKPDSYAITKDKLHYQTITKSTIKELAQELIKGKTIKSGILIDGTKELNWKEQQLFFVDVDDENVTIEQSIALAKKYDLKPALIYKSFSYTDTHQKHRLVFVSSRPIREFDKAKAIVIRLMAMFNGDDKCKDLGRLYFGTNKSDYILDEKAIISFTKLERLAKESLQIVDDKLKVIKEEVPMSEIALGESISYEEVLENIAKKPLNKTLSIGKESWDFISKEIKLTDALNRPLDTLFRCLMPNHEDKNPSAIIYEYEGKQLYRCCSKCKNPIDIIDVLSNMYSLDRSKVVFDIARAANVIIGSEYQQQCRIKLSTMVFDFDRVMPKESPIRKYLTRYNYLGAYELVLIIAGESAPLFSFTGDDEDICLYLTADKLKGRMLQRGMKGAFSSHKKISYFCKIGLLTKLRDEEIDKKLLAKLRKKQYENEHDKRADLYIINPLTTRLLESAMDAVEYRLNNKISNSNDSARRTLAAYGAEFANSVYVQEKELKLTEKDLKFIELMKRAAKNIISKQSYVSEKQLLRTIDRNGRHFTMKEKKDKLKDFRTLLLQHMNIKCVRVNKKNRALYNIDSSVTSNSEVYVFC